MLRSLIAVLALSCSAPAPAPAPAPSPAPAPGPAPRHRVPGSGCYDTSSAPAVLEPVSRALERAGAANARAYTAALARLKIAPTTLAHQQHPSHAIGPVFPGDEVDWELGQRANEVVRIRRVERPARVVELVHCGCAPVSCPPCPGGMAPRPLYYRLPAGARYAGEARVAYDATSIERTYLGACPAPTCAPCPPVP